MKHLDYLKKAPLGGLLTLQDLDNWPLQWFEPSELACKGSGSLKLDLRSAIRLDWLREKLGRPVVVNSAYRSPPYNAKVGGSQNSFHIHGKAFDLRYYQSSELVDLVEVALAVGFSGFGFYATFLHVDTGPRRSWIG